MTPVISSNLTSEKREPLSMSQTFPAVPHFRRWGTAEVVDDDDGSSAFFEKKSLVGCIYFFFTEPDVKFPRQQVNPLEYPSSPLQITYQPEEESDLLSHGRRLQYPYASSSD